MPPIALKALPDKRLKKHQLLSSGGLIVRLVVGEIDKGLGFVTPWLNY
jgi:hypothetical protein